MDRFEKQFENLDIQSTYMENAMQGTTQQFVPEDDVKQLMQKTADEAGYVMLAFSGVKMWRTCRIEFFH